MSKNLELKYDTQSDTLDNSMASKEEGNDLTSFYSTYFSSNDLTSTSQPIYQRWSTQEDSLLYNAVMEVSGGISPIRWKRISVEYFLGLRSESQCRYRWNRVIHPGLYKDVMMMMKDDDDDVNTNHHVCFVLPSKNTNDNTIRQMKKKKNPWTREDKIMLLQLVQHYGRLWNYIATYYFPERDCTSCQTMWYNLRQSEQRRRKRQWKNKKG